MSDDEKKLVKAAKSVRANAYAPYSGYLVGAAVLDESGQIHIGCNVENSAFPEGTCAEATAIGAMIAAGGRKIVAISAIGGREKIDACTPCGGCRQRIAEFSDNDTRVILIGEEGEIESYGVAELLPGFFRLR